jgi:hypothetical protein
MKWTIQFQADRVLIEGSSWEESGAMVEVLPDGTCRLFEIPQYGGAPRYYNSFDNLFEAMNEAESWT